VDISNRFRPRGVDVGSIIFQLERRIQFLGRGAAVIFWVSCAMNEQCVTSSRKSTACVYADELQNLLSFM
jgi:hypothetical protein